jgi:hypothetical protein
VRDAAREAAVLSVLLLGTPPDAAAAATRDRAAVSAAAASAATGAHGLATEVLVPGGYPVLVALAGTSVALIAAYSADVLQCAS